MTKNIANLVIIWQKIGLKKNPDLFNYVKILEYRNENENNQKILNNFFLTNNICEALHSKINYYIPKRATNAKDFITSLKKIFIYNLIKGQEIIRKDFKSKAIMLLIKDLDLNNQFKWIDAKYFHDYEKKVIMENNKGLNDIDINKIYTKLNENLDFKFNDIIDDIIIEENSDDENKMDMENNNKIIEQKDVLELEGKNLDSLDDGIISANKNEYDLKNIYDEVLKNMNNINVTDTNIKNEIENSPTNIINVLKCPKPRKRKVDSSSDSNKKKL